MAASPSAFVSINPAAVVMGRAKWKTDPSTGAPVPEKGTWYRFHGERAGSSVVIPMFGCPNCGRINFIVSDREQAEVLAGLSSKDETGKARHWFEGKIMLRQISRVGKVTPDVHCGGPGCGFFRAVYLDRWQDEKPLWCVAYIEGPNPRLIFDYTHAVNEREAAIQIGAFIGNKKIIASGPAVGFKVDEKTGAYSAD